MDGIRRWTGAALGALLLACGGGDGEPARQTEAPPPVSARGPAEETPREVAAGVPLTEEERRRFEADLDRQIAQLERQLRSVRDAAESEAGSLGQELAHRTRALEAKSAELRRTLDSMREASEDEWQTLRRNASRLVGDIQEESGRMIEALD